MRPSKLWGRLLGVEGFVLEDVDFDGDAAAVIVSLRPRMREQGRCPHCRRRCPGYDAGSGRRRWRAQDAGVAFVFIEADAPRVECPEHGVVVAAVPWARHGAWFTRPFEDETAWLVAHTDKTTVSTLMRISWRTVGRIIERVGNELGAKLDRFANLKRIGVDEVAYRKGHRYLTVVVDHDSGRLVWAHEGKDAAAFDAFFGALGAQRAESIELVSCDASGAYLEVLKSRCPNATVCLDPFHIVKWATNALDDVRRDVWNKLRRGGQTELAQTLKRSRYALWKNPENLTERQGAKLALIEKVNKPLYRAYLMKEQLREVFKLKGRRGVKLLEKWCAWARRSRLRPFIDLAASIRDHRDGIVAALEHGLSNARTEAANTKLRLITRLAFGFHSSAPMIALAMLRLGGLCPDLPGRR
jgi:transposase